MLIRVRRSIEEGDQGFTLIELLVVIVIIGILAAIAIPVFISQRKKAVEASEKSDLKNSVTALEGFYATNSAYPSSGITWTAGTHLLGSEQVVVSPGNQLTYVDPATYGTIGAYCVMVSNPAGTQDWVFKSDVGSMQPASSGPC